MPLSIYSNHTSDVMSISIEDEHNGSSNMFVSGSCDKTAKLYDIRLPNDQSEIFTYYGHSSDINTV